MANQIELQGRLTRAPELRVTPAGTPVMSCIVECAQAPEKLSLAVVMTGAAVRAIAARLGRGIEVTVVGRLRASAARIPGSAGVEVIATRIEVRAPA